MNNFGEKYGVTLMFLLPIIIFTVAFMDHIVIYLILGAITFIYSFTVETHFRNKYVEKPREIVAKKVGRYVIPAVFLFIIIMLLIVIIF